MSKARRYLSGIALAMFALNVNAATAPVHKAPVVQYENFTYTWTDAKLVEHTSNLSERATDKNQIVALLKEVYTNPAIPGFIKDPLYDSSVNPEDKYGKSKGDVYKVKYAPCTADPYNMKETDVVNTPVEGATALLVELNEKATNMETDPFDRIKAVSVLTHQLYIDGSEDNSSNPGYLFNYVGMLNKFFIITKGCNRVPNNVDTGDFAPFHQMFEEFSPANSGPVYGAYAAMNGGEQFGVDHNCSSVLGQNHITCMGTNSDNYDYPVNLLFYLPDYRFKGETRIKHDQIDSNDPNGTKDAASDYGYEWYTYYNNDHRPFVFFSKLVAEINDTPIADPKKVNTAKVKVEWVSSYKDITKSNVPEAYYIYRVVNGVMEPNPVPISELTILDSDLEYMTFSEDTGVTVSRKHNCQIYVDEPMRDEAYDVYYVVKGRRWRSNFEFVESNMVTATIPAATPGDIDIRIDGNGKSSFNIKAEKNEYENSISMIENESGAARLLRRHIALDNDNRSAGYFELFRVAVKENQNAGEPALVASMDVVGQNEETWNYGKEGVYVYDAVIRYTDGRENSSTQFKSKMHILSDGNDKSAEALEPLCALDGKNGVLATFNDIFADDTSNGDQTTVYKYYVEYVPNTVATFAEGNGVAAPIASNTVQVNIPVNDLKVGFIPYTADEIDHDENADDLLPLTKAAIKFDARSNPNVTEFVVLNAETGKELVKATRLPTGSLEVNRMNADGTLEKYQTYLEGKEVKPIVEFDRIDAGQNLTLKIVYNNGNTYGNRRVATKSLPTVSVYGYGLYRLYEEEDGKTVYNTVIAWNPNLINGFGLHNYRLWSKNEETLGDFSFIFGLGHQENEFFGAPSVHHEYLHKAHAATETNPVVVDHKIRMYTVIPEDLRIVDERKQPRAISEDGNDIPMYAVADTDHQTRISSTDGVLTGVDDIIVNPGEQGVPVYYDLTGRRVNADELTRGVYIRVLNGKSEKIMF